MSTIFTIQFDYNHAISQAKELERLADRIESNVVKKMDGVADDLNAAWKGESAGNYIRKEQQLRDQIKQTARELRDTAADIRRVAKRLYNAEMEAIRIAQE